MKTVILIQLMIALVGGGLLTYLVSTQGAVSFTEGALIIAANLLLLTWTWKKILSKKLIALATTVIVFKYAIFGAIIYLILNHPNTDKLWFGVGLGTMMVTGLMFAVLNSIKGQKQE